MPLTPHTLSRLAISIVSHGQGPLMRPLLESLRPAAEAGAEVIVTINLPEDEAFLADLGYAPHLVRNVLPRGFGANHNHAFAHAGSATAFAVLNPDIRCNPAIFAPLLALLAERHAGAVAPRVLSPQGLVEDSARVHPSVARIARRVVTRLRGARTQADYDLGGTQPVRVDWVAGMFIVFDAAAYRAVGGFDERFFMYLEDADIGRRLALHGAPVLVLPTTDVVHDARRATMRRWNHLRWHVASLLRYLARYARPQVRAAQRVH